MDRTTLGVAAALSAAIALPAGGANATAPTQSAVPQAQSFAELLDPVPNASERLRLADAQEAAPRLILAQYVNPQHHHHHRRWRRRRIHHHHHHHHHHHSNY